MPCPYLDDFLRTGSVEKVQGMGQIARDSRGGQQTRKRHSSLALVGVALRGSGTLQVHRPHILRRFDMIFSYPLTSAAPSPAKHTHKINKNKK